MQRRTFLKLLALAGGVAPMPGFAAAAAARASGTVAAALAPLPTLIGIGPTGHRVIAALMRLPGLRFGKCLLIEPRSGAERASEPVVPCRASVLDFPLHSGEVTLERYVRWFEALVPALVERGSTVLVVGHASELAGCELTDPVARAARIAGARVERVLLCRRIR